MMRAFLLTVALLWSAIASAQAPSGGPLLMQNSLSEIAARGTQSVARTSLGLGSLATQSAGAAAITGGTISGLSSLGVVGNATIGGTLGVTGAAALAATTAQSLNGEISIAGADLTGATDSTAAIQAAYTAVPVGGATVRWPPGAYKTSASIQVKSHTHTVFSAGAVVQPVPYAGFTPRSITGVGTAYSAFSNVNAGASSLTDTDITYESVRVEPTAAWAGHAIFTRMATQVKVIGGRFVNLGDATATLASDQVLVEHAYATAITNAAYDFWEGCTNVVVSKNVAVSVSNGVQFNALNTAGGGSYVAGPVLIDGNQITGLTLSGSNGIVVAPSPGVHTATTSIKGAQIVNNVVDELSSTTSGAGYDVSRVYGLVMTGNIFRNGNGQQPYFVTIEDTNATPGDTSIVSHNIVEDTTNTTVAGYFAVLGPNAIVSENVARNSTGYIAIQVSSPTTIVWGNILPGAAIPISNTDTIGTPTTPGLQLVGNASGFMLNIPATSCSGQPSKNLAMVGWVYNTTPGVVTICP